MALTLHYSPEVRKALDLKQAVVALESTIISHGMPFPQNLEVAMEVEESVRKRGAIPATIALLDGEIHIGLSSENLQKFASAQGVMKCSRRDLPFVLSNLFPKTNIVTKNQIKDFSGWNDQTCSIGHL